MGKQKSNARREFVLEYLQSHDIVGTKELVEAWGQHTNNVMVDEFCLDYTLKVAVSRGMIERVPNPRTSRTGFRRVRDV